MNTRTLTWLAMQGQILSYTILPLTNRKKGQACKAWAPSVYRCGLHPFCWEGWWVLYRLPPCPDKYLWDKRSLSLCDISQQGRRNQTFVFQHGFSKPATVILRLAGKSSPELDRKQPDAVYPPVSLFVPMEHWSKLLWAKILLVSVWVYVA